MVSYSLGAAAAALRATPRVHFPRVTPQTAVVGLQLAWAWAWASI